MRKSNTAIPKVCQELGLAYQTLKDWLAIGLCGRAEDRPKVDQRGREVEGLTPTQFERVQRFVWYHRWLARTHTREKIIRMLDELDAGEFEATLDLLIERRKTLEEEFVSIEVEITRIQSLANPDRDGES